MENFRITRNVYTEKGTITMTENEAIKIATHCLGVQAEQEVCEECPVYRESGIVCKEIARTVISALKEIQQYREIGTVEEVEQNARDLKRQIEHSERLANVLKATQNLLEKRKRLLKEYCKIGTVEECREAMEKQIPRKPRDVEYDHSYFVCGNCGTAIYTSDEFEAHLYCLNCGQAINWPDMNLEGAEDE